MKKYLLFILIMLVVGCGNKEKDAYKGFIKKTESSSYHVIGELLMYRGEDKYTYDVDVAYQEKDHYRVSLKNKLNNHEQIILRNDDGVYVITPSLNKSFKFQSDWPYNSSQIYILDRLASDLEDKDRKIEKTSSGYLFTCKVKYNNNHNLTKEKIYVDNEYNIEKVEVLDSNDATQMVMTFVTVEYDKKYDDAYFKLEENQEAVESKTSSILGDTILPTYLPVNTYLTNQEKISLDNKERVILTFSGESPFMLVEESVTTPTKLETSIVYGEPEFIGDTLGAISDSYVSWISDDIEYYLVSDALDTSDLLAVASSISATAVVK